MATLTTALNASFTPTANPFIAQVSSGKARLERQNTSGAAWVVVGELDNTGIIVDNPVAGANYRFTAMVGSPVVQADQ